MAYSLEDFCRDCRTALQADAGPAGRERVRTLLEQLLRDADFRATYESDDQPEGRRQVYEDPELGFCVLVYVMAEPRRSPPHDHGNSWAVYGQLAGYTEMTEFRRADGGRGAGQAALEETRRYRLNPGEAGLYDTDGIHAIDYPAGARFVRVTGTDLDHVSRLKFDMAAGTATEIENSTVPG